MPAAIICAPLSEALNCPPRIIYQAGRYAFRAVKASALWIVALGAFGEVAYLVYLAVVIHIM